MNQPIPGGPQPEPGKGPDWSDLRTRIFSAIALICIALITDLYGAMPFLVVWWAAASIIVFEWFRMVSPAGALLRALPQSVGLLLMGIALLAERRDIAVMVPGLLCVLAFAVSVAGARVAHAEGALYGASLLLSVMILRRSPTLGDTAILWLFAVVWFSDVSAYFAGRLIGGPKLWPAVSPKKTWAGGAGGTLGGVLAGLLLLWWAELPVSLAAAVAALLISLASQGGDLFESHMKRRFGVKDSGGIIPGHGGVMDRLDGFVVASTVAALVGLWREPLNAAAGILVWN